MAMYEDNLHRPQSHQPACPECGQRLPPAERDGDGDLANPAELARDEASVTIARFVSAAEAGYFAEELNDAHGFPVAIRLIEDFDALAGVWHSRFALVAPVAIAAEATGCLKELIAATDDDNDWFDPAPQAFSGKISSDRFSPDMSADDVDERDAPEASHVNWVPILLTLAAGSAVFLVARKGPNPPVERAHAAGHHPVDFWEELATDSEPWVQQTNQGRGVRELWVVPGQRKGVLREDADGDGTFEREIRFEQ